MAQQRFQQLMEFLTTLTEVNSDAANTMEQNMRLVRGCLRDFVSGPPVAMSAGTAMLREVQESSIPQWMKTEVIRAVENKMCQHDDAQRSSRTAMQKNMFLFNYFDEKEWGVLMNGNQGVEPKLQVIKGRCLSIGLTHPTEPTCVLANAILHIAAHTGPIENLQVDSRRSLALLKEIKTMVKLGCKRVRHSGIVIYPADPGDLPQELRASGYNHGPAVDCPLDIRAIEDLASILPARDTHHEIRGKHSFNKSRSQCEENMGAMVGNWLCNNLLAGWAQAGGANGINLQMLGNGGVKRKHSQLAIEDVKEQEERPGTEDKPCENKGPADEEEKKEALNPKGIDGMAAAISTQLDANSSEKNGKTPKGKAKAKAKAKAKGKATTTASGGSANLKSLVFPGTAARAPIYYEDKIRNLSTTE
eukprot:Skav225684  [mRNA]  locus=scaffold243:47283:48536:- [translate_table: standard]